MKPRGISVRPAALSDREIIRLPGGRRVLAARDAAARLVERLPGIRAAPGGGYELWLAGLDNALRGKGHGRAMLKALFATPTGQQTRFMRVRREGGYANAVAKLLAEHGFTPTRETKNETWFVRAAATSPGARGASPSSSH